MLSSQIEVVRLSKDLAASEALCFFPFGALTRSGMVIIWQSIVMPALGDGGCAAPFYHGKSHYGLLHYAVWVFVSNAHDESMPYSDSGAFHNFK